MWPPLNSLYNSAEVDVLNRRVFGPTWALRVFDDDYASPNICTEAFCDFCKLIKQKEEIRNHLNLLIFRLNGVNLTTSYEFKESLYTNGKDYR